MKLFSQLLLFRLSFYRSRCGNRLESTFLAWLLIALLSEALYEHIDSFIFSSNFNILVKYPWYKNHEIRFTKKMRIEFDKPSTLYTTYNLKQLKVFNFFKFRMQKSSQVEDKFKIFVLYIQFERISFSPQKKFFSLHKKTEKCYKHGRI